MSFIKRSVVSLILFFSGIIQAVTIQSLGPADQLVIDSLVAECSEPGIDCPRLALDSLILIEYLESGEEYIDSQEILTVTKEAGLLVHYSVEESTNDIHEYRRFFPLSKVALSPDEHFYMCPEGGEFQLVLDNDNELSLAEFPNLDPIGLFQSGYRPKSFPCKCFWAPQEMFDELGVNTDKLKSPRDDSELPIDWPEPPRNVDGGSVYGGVRGDRGLPTGGIYGQGWYALVGSGTRSSSNGSHRPRHSKPDVPGSSTIAPIPIGGECGLFLFPCLYDFVQGLFE